MGVLGSGGRRESCCVAFWERSEETIERVMGEQRDYVSLTEFQVLPLLSGVHTLILVKSLTRCLTIRSTRLQKLLPKAVGRGLFPGDPLEEAQDRGHLFPSWFGS